MLFSRNIPAGVPTEKEIKDPKLHKELVPTLTAFAANPRGVIIRPFYSPSFMLPKCVCSLLQDLRRHRQQLLLKGQILGKRHQQLRRGHSVSAAALWVVVSLTIKRSVVRTGE